MFLLNVKIQKSKVKNRLVLRLKSVPQKAKTYKSLKEISCYCTLTLTLPASGQALNSNNMRQQPVPQFWFKPGAFGRHDITAICNVK